MQKKIAIYIFPLRTSCLILLSDYPPVAPNRFTH